jgi:enediyne biosynthesis protein E4
MRNRIGLATSILLLAALSHSQPPPLHFVPRDIAFRLENCETLRHRAPETMAGGLALFDCDNDGDLDVFFANGADIGTLKKTDPKYSNRLLVNDGKANFTDATARAGLAGTGFDTGAVVGDYDNDGRKDLFVAGVHRNTLYRNNGDGTFSDVTAKAGLTESADPEHGQRWAVHGAFADFNRDALLDLFVVNYLVWDAATEPECQFQGLGEYCHPKQYRGLPNQLFLNNGDGTFRDASSDAGLRKAVGKGMGAAVADSDFDGNLDVFVSNDKLYNFYFRGLDGARFEERAFEAGVALAAHGNLISGMGADFRDLDNDSYPDIVLVALDNETFPVYRNSGQGDFLEVTARSGMTVLSRSMAGYSPNVADLDNDGWKDIFVSRGHVQSPAASRFLQVDQPNTVFRNGGNLKFAALTVEAGFGAAPPRRHRGAAIGDLNGDGLSDIVVSALSAPAEIWLNDSPAAGHWLGLSLEGTRSNRDAVGARVKVVSKSGTRFDHVNFAAGYASSSAAPIHIGLGPDGVADVVEVIWPSGGKSELRDVRADRVVRLTEPRQ